MAVIESGKMLKKAAVSAIIICMAALTFSCAGQKGDEQQIVLTSGFEEGEVFFVGSEKCLMPEINVYMRTSQSQYEHVYGQEIWNRRIGTQTLEQKLKDMALARLARIKVMKLMAADMGIELSEEENTRCLNAAKIYMDSLSPADIALMGIDPDTISDMYREYALADKVYREVTSNVNPEISDDEARIVTVRQILIKKADTDINGRRIEYTERMKQDAYERALQVHNDLKNGADFDTLSDRYNEDTQTEYSFGRDAALPQIFIDTAFSMENGSISDIVETDYGYHILLCENTFDVEETDANKEKILNRKKEEVFSKIYDEFVLSCYSDLNTELWNSVTFDRSVLETDKSFFDVYYESL